MTSNIYMGPRLTEAETMALQARLNNLILQTHEILGAGHKTDLSAPTEAHTRSSKKDIVLFLGGQKVSSQ